MRPAGGQRDLAATWARFLAGRAASALGVLLVLVLLTFVLVHLIPGDPVRGMLGPGATPAQVADVRTQLHLDDPLSAQLAGYVTNLLDGDLGTSFDSRRPVAELVANRLPTTVTLAALAVLFVFTAGLALGTTAAVLVRRYGGWLDGVFTALMSSGGSLPEYIAGTLVVLVFAVTLGVLPAAGVHGAESYVLPVVAVGIGPASTLARIVRREMATVLDADYMRTARAKRLPVARTYLLHALPNALTSTLTYGGLLLIGLLGGTVVVESVFNLQGLGQAVVQAVQLRDYPVIQGAVLILGALAVLVLLVLDIVVGAIDPRSRLGVRR